MFYSITYQFGLLIGRNNLNTYFLIINVILEERLIISGILGNKDKGDAMFKAKIYNGDIRLVVVFGISPT